MDLSELRVVTVEPLTFASALYSAFVLGGIVLLIIVIRGLLVFGSHVWNTYMSGASTMETPSTATLPHSPQERRVGFDSLARPTSYYDRVPPLYQIQIMEGGTSRLIAYYSHLGEWKVRYVKEIDATLTNRFELLIAEAVHSTPRNRLMLPAQNGKHYEGRYHL